MSTLSDRGDGLGHRQRVGSVVVVSTVQEAPALCAFSVVKGAQMTMATHQHLVPRVWLDLLQQLVTSVHAKPVWLADMLLQQLRIARTAQLVRQTTITILRRHAFSV
jgi:hypothetical protein